MIAKVAASVAAAAAAESRSIYVVYYNPVDGHCFDASPNLVRRFGRTLEYAAEELGCGPDTDDAVAIWQGGGAPQPVASTSFRIKVVHGMRAVIES